MSIIKYRVGYENSVIVEQDNYQVSIFADQYRHSLNLIEGFLKQPIQDSLQIISYCGERGSGKTSCMKSVLEIIEKLAEKKENDATHLINELKLGIVKSTRFEITKMIDPSFFDSHNNIMELLLGQLYGEVMQYQEDNKMKIDRISYNEVLDGFSKVRECLLTIHGNEKHSFNDYTELSVLSQSVRLKENIQALISGYLKLKGKDILIIPVDDIDLNIKGAYEMCEQIRKYLCVPQCVLMISFKYDQLQSAVALSLGKNYPIANTCDSKGFSDTDEKIMSVRYLDKFIPASQRIHMPRTYDLCNRTLRIYDGDSVVLLPTGIDSVKDVVVNLIFQKTRFLFYNSKGGISPIVPNNLRELFQLLGMIWNMPKLPSNKEDENRRSVLETNKHEFKIYFFNYWTKCLDEKYLSSVKEWTQNTSDTTLNKVIVSWLSKEFAAEIGRNYDDEIEEYSENRNNAKHQTVSNIIECITSGSNFSYNVSLGDVFYLINLLEKDVLSPQKEKILFFIKSYYSIRLFETYDIVTEFEDGRYPISSEEDSGIYRIDHRFDHTNDLQRLVNGGYFTFRPGELIQNNSQGKNFDSRIIKGDREHMAGLFSECKVCIDAYDEIISDLEKLKSAPQSDVDTDAIEKLSYEANRLKRIFRMSEFFIFTTLRAIIQKDVSSFYSGKDEYRANVIPNALQQYNDKMGYYVFNILAPFYVLINPEYAYSRFDKLMRGNSDSGSRMFDFAITHDFSILRSMIHVVRGETINSEDIETFKNRWLSDLQSDGIIRNAEVLTAIFENAVSVRDKDRDSNVSAKWAAFYKNIMNSHMATHNVDVSQDSKPYPIRFSFLNSLIDFINRDLENEDLNTLFIKIFDGAQDETLQKSNDAKRQKKKVKSTKPQTITSVETVNLDPTQRGKFVGKLKKYLGDTKLTAVEIYERLRVLSPSLQPLDDKALKAYVNPRRRNVAYSLELLTDDIFKDKSRYDYWCNLFEELENNNQG